MRSIELAKNTPSPQQDWCDVGQPQVAMHSQLSPFLVVLAYVILACYFDAVCWTKLASFSFRIRVKTLRILSYLAQ